MTIKLLFGTSNSHKLAEAKGILEPYNFSIQHYPVDLIEPQASDLQYIARYSLEKLPNTSDSLFVEDTGLFVESLKGFPGPYAAYIYKTIGYQGILTLLSNSTKRKAYFESVIAYRDTDGSISIFSGRINGWISIQGAGNKGFGFDPIFIPESDVNPERLTFANLETDVKNQISHRSLALIKLREFLLG